MDPARAEVPTCPFCTFPDPDGNSNMDHFEVYHPEIDRRLGVNSGKKAIHLNNLKISSGCRQHLSASEENEHLGKYTHCPRGCGEIVMDAELPTHLELHQAEEITHESTTSSPPEFSGSFTAQKQSRPGDCEDLDNAQYLHGLFVKSQLKKEKPTQEAVRETRPRSPSNITLAVKKLGRTELGPYAHEKQMPSWLRKLLEKGVKITESNIIAPDGTLRRHRSMENETTDVVPVLVRLCEQDKSVQRAFFCSPKVHQISKMPKEGAFCGYRNIQMLISYIKECRVPGHECFSETSPTILQIQEMIESAWDMGFNSIGRIETGGIRGTRKYIGTPEAQALFLSLGIQCETSRIGVTKDMQAHDVLFMCIANYFRQACSLDTNDKVFQTNLPPIYFQHQGHSLTIIGFEIRDNGSANLLVLDPMFKPSSVVKRLRGTRAVSADPARILKGYRRGAAYLKKYKVFEILKLSTSQDLVQDLTCTKP
ncbi:peptidase family C78-domain-containing protein [Aspergillus minisclerotigenes]|uniref:Peptidase family C78-domain-containing protein n=1 Tax=Aspergillus minisclerotigenes TaxID=656917 RepID=A0A5N6JAZ0_9EURO|nr:peptidase family C78-domain-containing protein [Aspergillus minisclerotigenes]